MRNARSNRFALLVSLFYGLVAGAWILLSDHAVTWLVPDANAISHFQTLKGLAFVLVTALLLFLVMRQQLNRWSEEQDRRQAAESARRISEQKLQAIFDLSFEFIGLLRKDGTVIEANQSALDFAGVSAQAVRGKPFWETPWWTHSTTEQERLRHAIHRAANGEFVRMEVTHRAPNGQLHYVDFSLRPARNESGEVTWLIPEGRNITERKLAEQALRESESRFRQLADSLPQLVWTCAPDGPCDFLSHQWTRYTGVPAANQLGAGWLEQIHPADRAPLSQAWSATVARGEPFQFEYRIRRHDGEYRWFDGQAVPLRNNDGRIVRWVGASTDIHEQRELREALRSSEAKWRTIFNSEPECLKLIEPDSTAREINPAGLRILEADDATQVLGKPLLPLVVPKDRDAVLAALTAATRGESKALEFQIANLKGNRRWLEMHVTRMPDSPPGQVLLLAVSREITERKQAEESLRMSKERLKACIENTPNLAVQWYDESGRIMFWNPASEQMFGWRANEVLGRTVAELNQPPAHAARFLDIIRTIKQNGEKVGPVEWEFHRKDGTVGIRLSTVFAIPFDAQINCYVCMDVDITDRSRSQEQTRQSLSLLQATLEATADGILVVNAEGRITSYNRKFIETWRLPETILNDGDDARVLEFVKNQLTDPESFLADVRNIYRHPENASFDVITFKDGRTFERHSHPQRLGNEIVGRVWSFRDVTERRRVEKLVVQSELRLRLVWESSLLAMHLTDADGRLVLVNSAFCRLVGKSRTELEGEPISVTIHESASSRTMEDHQHRFEARRETASRPCDITFWNGKRAQLEISDVFLQLADQPPLLLSVINDVTLRKQSEQQTAVFAEMARKLSAANSRRAAAEIIVEAAQKLVGWDACLFHLFDADKNLIENVLTRDTIAGRIQDVPMADSGGRPSPIADEVMRTGPKLILRDESARDTVDMLPFGDRGRRSASLMYVPVHEADRTVAILSVQSYTPQAYNNSSLQTLQNLADHCAGALTRIRAEEAFQRHEKQFRSLIENASDLITVINQEGVIQFQSPSVERLLGYQPEALIGRRIADLLHPDDLALVMQALKPSPGETGEPVTAEYRLRHSNGGWRRLESIGRSAPEYAGEGWIIVNSRDVTESRALEEQFRQSQKMEAIGQLAGGVAHDFNNLLAVIQMQAELLKLEPGLSPAQLESTNEISKAATRAANLTRQLLIFSRRQALKPRNLNLNEIVANVAKMLQRLLGEDVRIQLHYAPEPLFIHADNVMIDQILLNLSVNSRDAMPRGGQLTIGTARVEFDATSAAQLHQARPGVFACLSVSDTGVGIAPEILPHVFEPFFTTKDVGKGTGLGLATVFGLVQQHHGWINVQSEVGVGTTFRIYLPLLEVSPAEPGHDTSLSAIKRGAETILLVEDEPALRALVRTVLTRLGYRVLEAATGPAALEVWNAHRSEIQLLLTDLVMPDGINGRELAQRLQAQSPHLKVIYTSGYSLDVAGPDLPLREGENFIAKPFHATKLAKIVRARLDAR